MWAFKPGRQQSHGGVTRLFKCRRSVRSMHLPAACLFDLDGLLLDTEPLHGQAWSDAAAVFGTQLSNQQLLSLRGRRRLDCAQQVIDWISGSANTEQLLAVRQPIARRLLSTAQPMPGAEELVRWCHQQSLSMALVTSSSSASLAFKSAPHPWLDLIQTRVLGDDEALANGKPAPDPYLLAAERLGVDPASCWALEDSLSGTQSALRAGCQVWVLDGSSANPDPGNSPSTTNPRRIDGLSVVLGQLQALRHQQALDQ